MNGLLDVNFVGAIAGQMNIMVGIIPNIYVAFGKLFYTVGENSLNQVTKEKLTRFSDMIGVLCSEND